MGSPGRRLATGAMKKGPFTVKEGYILRDI